MDARSLLVVSGLSVLEAHPSASDVEVIRVDPSRLREMSRLLMNELQENPPAWPSVYMEAWTRRGQGGGVWFLPFYGGMHAGIRFVSSRQDSSGSPVFFRAHAFRTRNREKRICHEEHIGDTTVEAEAVVSLTAALVTGSEDAARAVMTASGEGDLKLELARWPDRGIDPAHLRLVCRDARKMRTMEIWFDLAQAAVLFGAWDEPWLGEEGWIRMVAFLGTGQDAERIRELAERIRV